MDDAASVGELTVDDASIASVAGALDGELDAEYRRHFPSLMRIAFLMTGSDPVAEDLVHDVFVRCAHRLADLEDPGSYLRASVINACRRHHRRELRSVDEPAIAITPEPATADAVAVRQALTEMSPKRRAALVLRYFEDMTHNDIAAVLGCRTATARSLVRRGLEDLRGAFDES